MDKRWPSHWAQCLRCPKSGTQVGGNTAQQRSDTCMPPKKWRRKRRPPPTSPRSADPQHPLHVQLHCQACASCKGAPGKQLGGGGRVCAITRMTWAACPGSEGEQATHPPKLTSVLGAVRKPTQTTIDCANDEYIAVAVRNADPTNKTSCPGARNDQRAGAKWARANSHPTAAVQMRLRWRPKPTFRKRVRYDCRRVFAWLAHAMQRNTMEHELAKQLRA